MRSSTNRQDPYIGAGISLAVVLFLFYVYPGFLVPVASHFEGACRTIAMGAGAEDLRIDSSNGLAYLSYFDEAQRQPRRLGNGTVMLMDLNAAEPRVRAALATEPAHFVPTGLSLFTPANGPKRLFVVNRAELGTHSVEIFEQTASGTFAPVATIRDRLFWSPTAIVAVGPNQFYVVNDAGFRMKDESEAKKGFVGSIRSGVESVRSNVGRLRFNLGTVVYYDGERAEIVAGGMRVANGVALSPDGGTLYVTESGAGQVQVFSRDTATGKLQRKDRIEIGGAPHNITVDAEGNLWVTTHPRMEWLLRVTGESSRHFPTQVVKVTPGAEPGKQVTNVYTNDGHELSSGTVAAPRGNQLVIGSVTDHKLLLCTQGADTTASTRPAITGPEKED